MKYWYVFLLTWLVNPLALPQQAVRQEATLLEAPPPWRVQLRSALQAAREPAAPSTDASSSPQAQQPPKRLERHLSEQERANLRQQLRQQRHDNQVQRP